MLEKPKIIMDKIEEIKKLASLLKEGAIKQEEFNALLKELLYSIDNYEPSQMKLPSMFGLCC
jgi:hypothetical protein